MKVTPLPPVRPALLNNDPLRIAAVELEAAFLGEMLKSAGMGQTSQSFGGGAGEDQFSSFLVQQQALQLARSGGVGLSETLFQSLMENTNVEKT